MATSFIEKHFREYIGESLLAEGIVGVGFAQSIPSVNTSFASPRIPDSISVSNVEAWHLSISKQTFFSILQYNIRNKKNEIKTSISIHDQIQKMRIIYYDS